MKQHLFAASVFALAAQASVAHAAIVEAVSYQEATDVATETFQIVENDGSPRGGSAEVPSSTNAAMYSADSLAVEGDRCGGDEAVQCDAGLVCVPISNVFAADGICKHLGTLGEGCSQSMPCEPELSCVASGSPLIPATCKRRGHPIG